MSEVYLSAAVRSNLLALQNTSSLIDRTQGRLSTGLAVNSPTDNAIKYFQSKSLSDRASDLSQRKDSIDQGVSTLKTVVEATTSMEDLVNQIKGVIDSARSATKDQRKEYAKQVNELVIQVQNLVGDASYKGLNLLNSTSASLTVRFSDKDSSKLKVDGVNFNASAFFQASDGSAALSFTAGSGNVSAVLSGLGFNTDALSAYNLSNAADLASFNSQANLAISRLDKTIENLRAKSETMANNLAILQTRLDFTDNYVNVLQEGSDKLRLADLNSEGANLLALQTRQQLGIQSLSFAGQAESSILRLFG
jgi:flagellin-like hook-associated protein FlgL